MHFDEMDRLLSDLFAGLSANDALKAKIGTAIFDAPPIVATMPEIYVQIGDGLFRDASSVRSQAREMLFDVSVFAKREAFSQLMGVGQMVQEIVLKRKDGERPVSFRSGQIYRLDNGELKKLVMRFRKYIEMANED